MYSLWRFIVIVFRFAWRLLCFIRDLVLNIAFLIFVALFSLIFIEISSDYNRLTSSIQDAQDGVLLLDLKGVIVEEIVKTDPLHVISSEFNGQNTYLNKKNSVFEFLDLIRQAKNDNKIEAIVLSLDDFSGGSLVALEALGDALKDFKSSGKKIYSFGRNYSQAQYYLASFADEIYLAPLGSVEISGFNTNNMYYKTLLDNIHAKVEVFRVGNYKSAVEPYIRDDMSPEAKENASRWLTRLWNNYTTTIIQNRHSAGRNLDLTIDANVLYQRLQQISGDSTKYALQYNLIDKISSYQEFNKEMIGHYSVRSGSNEDQDTQSNVYRHVSIYDYALRPLASHQNKIAVVIVSGTISEGFSATDIAGSLTITEELDDILNDPSIKAVVLRVNSPGGSVTASEHIRSKLEEIRQANIPIVVSMGGLAASGGYWISTPANYIIASSSTITGSIGIFGIVPNLEESLASIGIHTDGVETSSLSAGGVFKAIPPEVARLIQLNIDNGYKTFVKLVADSRNMSVDKVNEIAQGQVWSGFDAKENHLVDQIGSFDDAVKKAAELAKLPKNSYQLVWAVGEPSLAEVLLNSLSASVDSRIASAIVSALPTSLWQPLQQINKDAMATIKPDPNYRYIYCLECSYSY